MEALSQLDVTNPDHISVITRDGKVTISVLKDGTSVTLGFPIRSTSPVPPLQQSVPMIVKKGDQAAFKPIGAPGTTHVRYRGPIPKLNVNLVREIKRLLKDASFMDAFPSKTQAFEAIGRKYNVTGCAIGNIARGIAWTQVKA